MAVLRETIDTTLPVEEAYAFVADFGNAEKWDPGVAASERIGGESGPVGPIGVGTRFRLAVRIGGRVAPMDYVITAWQPTQRVVLAGTGSGVTAVDDIRFEATPTGTRIDYTADIRLRGLMRLLSPFAGGALARIGRDASDGMQRALDRLASAGPPRAEANA